MDEWRSELEALQRLLARQQLQIDALHKQLGAPADAEEVDLPAAEYRRVFLVAILFLLYDSAMMLTIAFASGRGDEGNLGQVESVIWPICWTVMFGILLGTMDSSVAGRHALLLIRCWLSSQVVIIPILYWSSGKYEEAVFMFFVFIVNTIYWSWLGKVVLEILRKRGARLATLAEHYSVRALKVLGFQILLGIAALAQGVNGRESYARLYATFVFSVALSCVWIFMVVIYDVCSVDGRAAVKLRLSPLQAMALATSGLYALSGLAAYLIANQRRPSKQAAKAAGYLMMLSGLISMAFVGRLAAIARRGHDVPPAASVKPVDALGSLDLPGA